MSGSGIDSELAMKILKEYYHPLWTPKQIKIVPLNELRMDAYLWSAYERGWCSVVESYMSSQLMQTEMKMTMLEVSDEMRKKTGGRQSVAIANGDRNVTVPKSSPGGGGRGGKPVLCVTPKPQATEKEGRWWSPPAAAGGERGGKTADNKVHTTAYGGRRTAGQSDGTVARRAMPPPLPLPPPSFRLRRTAGPHAFALYNYGVETSAVGFKNRSPPAESVDYVPSAAEFRVINDDNDLV